MIHPGSTTKVDVTRNSKQTYKQECIPVGCVPPALYRTGGGGSLSARWSLSTGVSVRETPSPRGQTDDCENITLDQTSFAGGNDDNENGSILSAFKKEYSPSYCQGIHFWVLLSAVSYNSPGFRYFEDYRHFHFQPHPLRGYHRLHCQYFFDRLVTVQVSKMR